MRDLVILRVGGGIRTGCQIAIAAMMGAEKFGFSTLAMIAEGCVMARMGMSAAEAVAAVN